MHSITSMQESETLSRRDCLTSAAAAALGYTLAAGPVRAAAIKTGTEGLSAGAAKVKVPGGEMPVYYAKPLDAAKPPVVLVAMEVFGLHEHINGCDTAAGQARSFRNRARLLFPAWRPHPGHPTGATDAACQQQARS